MAVGHFKWLSATLSSRPTTSTSRPATSSGRQEQKMADKAPSPSRQEAISDNTYLTPPSTLTTIQFHISNINFIYLYKINIWDI
ncbi:hypothetical protein CsSME_00037479 [Camellia sinensis var. sinensis]